MENCKLLLVLMRDEKEGRKKQARSNTQQGKATQHTQSYGSDTHLKERGFLSLVELDGGVHARGRVAQHVVHTVHVSLLQVVDAFDRH